MKPVFVVSYFVGYNGFLLNQSVVVNILFGGPSVHSLKFEKGLKMTQRQIGALMKNLEQKH